METGVLLRERIAVRSISLSTRLVLTAMVLGSAGIRFLFGLRRPTANYLPDEYTYSALARGIADTGRPAIRGVTVHFPSLLEPLLAAPAWLTGDPALALRLTQAEHAILMSLGAIPVYLICKRLSLQNWVSLASAGLALVTPNLLYSSFIVSEPVAYPLLLAAVYSALVALEAPSKRAQLAFVAFAALATFARVQYLIVVPVLLGAALLVERGNLRRVVAKCGVALGVFAALGVAVLVSGPGRAAGVYGGLAHRHVSVASVGHQLGMHLVLVAFSSGIVLLPGALVGLGRGLVKPLSAAEHAFSALTVVLAVALLADAVFIGAAVSGNYGERYLICLFPLLAPAFALYARRGGATIAALLLAAGLAVVAMRVPLSHYVAKSSDSTLLYAAMKAEDSFGRSNGALAFSAAALFLAVTAAFVARRPHARVALAFAVAAVAQVAVGAAATAWDITNSSFDRHAVLPADPRWVDDAHVGPVTLLQPKWSDRGASIEQLFWNTSLTQVALLPGAHPVDAYSNPRVRVARDGTMLGAHGPLRGAVLVDSGHTWITFADAKLVKRFRGVNATSYQLWRPSGTAVRVAAEAYGISADGWLNTKGTLTVWPSARPRTLTMRLSLPSTAAQDTIHFTLGAAHRSLTVRPGGTGTISFQLPPGGSPVALHWSSDKFAFLPTGQSVSFRTAPPRLVTR